ncbi:MAG: DUF5312 domain-containing protein [Treponema sp.]|jgi:hypothetical protein|nr:DUF5312 domain-containing protein [Treponema sp.]
MTDSHEDNTLHRLVSELTLEERNNFLEKLRGQSTLSYEPMYETWEDMESGEMCEAQYTRLPWYVRLCYLILSLLKSKSPVKVFEEGMMNRLGHQIAAEAPGLYDHQKNLLLLGFFDLLTELKDAARFFYTALDLSVNRDSGGFYAFLGSLEMGDLHRRLETETIPELFTEKLDASERELRQAAVRAMEVIFSAINDTQRSIMYANARSLNCLKELAAFGFDRIIITFGSSGGGQTCPVNAVRDLLMNLNNILFSLKDPPAMALLESLFIYRLQERSGEPGFDMNAEIHSLLGMAEGAITTIRDFNKKVPLTRILRCASRDMTLVPQQISGGEEWFAIYRDYWKKQVEAKATEYIRQRKYKELLNSFRFFLKGTNLKVLYNAVSETNPKGLPVPEAFALSFLLTFHAAILVNDANMFLRPILIDGEFFKKENRAEYTGAYNDIMKLEEDIRQFDLKLSPAGEYGTHYSQAKEDMSALSIKRRKMQQVLDEVSHEASGIVIRGRNAIISLINVLNGILKKEAGGKYDTLANIDKLAGKTPEVFLDGVTELVNKFQQALRIIKDIDTLGDLRQ